MSKHQTRHSISMNRATYTLVHEHCEHTKQSISKFVEGLVLEAIGPLPAPLPPPPPVVRLSPVASVTPPRPTPLRTPATAPKPAPKPREARQDEDEDPHRADFREIDRELRSVTVQRPGIRYNDLIKPSRRAVVIPEGKDATPEELERSRAASKVESNRSSDRDTVRGSGGPKLL